MPRKVAVIAASLRKASFSRALAEALVKLAPPDLVFEFVEIGELPLYNQDLETDTPPKAWTDFRARIAGNEAVLFVTPEYNRGVPGALKNAIDVGSRPYGSSVWAGKPTAIVSNSPGAIGGFGANHQLRQSLVFLGMPVLQHEAYIGQSHTLVDENRDITNEGSRDFLKATMQTFADWIETTAKKP
jgi:chromate reductase